MSDFKAKMHQIRFRLGLRSHPTGGAYSAPPDPLSGFMECHILCQFYYLIIFRCEVVKYQGRRAIEQGCARDLSDRDETRDAKVRDRDETETLGILSETETETFQLPRPWPRRVVKKLSTTKSNELANTLYL